MTPHKCGEVYGVDGPSFYKPHHVVPKIELRHINNPKWTCPVDLKLVMVEADRFQVILNGPCEHADHEKKEGDEETIKRTLYIAASARRWFFQRRQLLCPMEGNKIKVSVTDFHTALEVLFEREFYSDNQLTYLVYLRMIRLEDWRRKIKQNKWGYISDSEGSDSEVSIKSEPVTPVIPTLDLCTTA
jgi:hypothetical protein